MIQCTEHIHACIAPEVGALLMQFELGKLSKDERERFERHLFDCDFCLAEASAMRLTADAMIANRTELIETFAKDKMTVEALLDEAVGTPKLRLNRRPVVDSSTRPRTLSWENFLGPKVGVALACAAAFMLVIGLGVFDGQKPIELTAYAPPTWLAWQSRSATPGDSLLIIAQISYAAKNYASTASTLESYLSNLSTRDDAQAALYLGVSYFELEQYQQAETALARISAANSVISEEAMFYRALILIKQGENDGAMKILQQIMNENSTRMDEARDLMAIIKNSKG